MPGQRIDSRTGRCNSRPRRSVRGSPGPHNGTRRDAKPLAHAFVIAAPGVRHGPAPALGSMPTTCPNVWRSPGRRGTLHGIAAAAALEAAGPTVVASRPRRVAAHGQRFAMGFGTAARPGAARHYADRLRPDGEGKRAALRPFPRRRASLSGLRERSTTIGRFRGDRGRERAFVRCAARRHRSRPRPQAGAIPSSLRAFPWAIFSLVVRGRSAARIQSAPALALAMG